MKLGIISGPPTFTPPIASADVSRVERFTNGDVILIDTRLTRYTFIVRRARTCAGTLAGGDFYDPVWAVLLGRSASTEVERAAHLQVGSEARFHVSVEGSLRLHAIPDVVRLKKVRGPSLDFATNGAGAAMARW